MLDRKNIGINVLVASLLVALGFNWEAESWLYVLTVATICFWFYIVKKELFLSASIGTVIVMLFVLIGSGISGLTTLLVFALVMGLCLMLNARRTREHV